MFNPREGSTPLFHTFPWLAFLSQLQRDDLEEFHLKSQDKQEPRAQVILPELLAGLGWPGLGRTH
jgi:hypothetical protein